MNELQFVSFIINETDEDYAHFVQYDIILYISNYVRKKKPGLSYNYHNYRNYQQLLFPKEVIIVADSCDSCDSYKIVQVFFS